MITHHSLPAEEGLPEYLRRSSCGKVMCRIAYDPEHDWVHAHADGTPYGSGSSNWTHVDCEECLRLRHWTIDRTGWPPGPWDGEPDKVQFSHAGLPCLIVRNHSGALCGYVGLPPDHPVRLRGTGNLQVSVHGGLSYEKKCKWPVCHVPEPGETDDILWLGFDCGHILDSYPEYERPGAEYRDIAYVRTECEQLADQFSGAPQ